MVHTNLSLPKLRTHTSMRVLGQELISTQKIKGTRDNSAKKESLSKRGHRFSLFPLTNFTPGSEG